MSPITPTAADLQTPDEGFREAAMARVPIFINGISDRLIATYLALQVADILVTGLAWRMHSTLIGLSLFAFVPVLSPVVSFFVVKAAAFVCLIGIVVTGRRRVLMFLNCWFAAYLAGMLLMML